MHRVLVVAAASNLAWARLLAFGLFCCAKKGVRTRLIMVQGGEPGFQPDEEFHPTLLGSEWACDLFIPNLLCHTGGGKSKKILCGDQAESLRSQSARGD